MRGMGDPTHEIVTIYAQTRKRLSDLLDGIDDDRAVPPVPACPGWTVKDVLAHVVGVCSDVLDGNINGVATDPWTAAQVAKRAGARLPDLLDEWDQVGPQVEAMAPMFPGRMAEQWVADAATH